MKKYLITIKKIQITSMYVSEKSAKRAVEKVDDLMKKCDSNNVNLDKTFDQGSLFSYKVELIKKDK